LKFFIFYKAEDHENKKYYSKTELIINSARKFAGKVFKIVVWSSIILIVTTGVISGLLYFNMKKNEYNFQLDAYNMLNNSKFRECVLNTLNINDLSRLPIETSNKDLEDIVKGCLNQCIKSNITQ